MKANHLFLSTVAVILAAFFMGVLIGRATVSTGVDEITNFIKNNELNTESYLIEQELIGQFEEANCGAANSRMEELSRELWAIGKELSAEDARKQLGDESYSFLKRKYHLMQIRAYIMLKKLSEICDSESHVALFYFSQNDPDSSRQGEVLDRAVQAYNLTVFAIERSYSKELMFLEEYYRISTTPSLIIDYEEKFTGFADYDEIEPLFR
jgi:hypothetical protein